MIWWKFAKFPMSFSKPQSVFLQILDHSSVSWKINPLYLFSSNNIYFVQKEPIKVKIFDTFKCSGQNLPNSSCQFWNDTLIPLQILYHSSVSWKITPMYFFSSTSIYFAQKEHIKVNIFETFKCSGQNYWFVKSILKRQVNSSSNFASFFIVMTHNSFVNFKLIRFLLWIKGPHQTPNFEILKYSGEDLPYSSFHFPNHKSVFLQILHHSLLSLKITPLYFFRSNFKYFAQ